MLINKRLIDVNCLDVLDDHGLAKREIMDELKGKYLRVTSF